MFLKVLFATQEQVEACPDSGVLYTGISAHLIPAATLWQKLSHAEWYAEKA
jgi:hypothetical protein